MSIETMLDHTCNIYHAIKESSSPGYGLPSFPSFDYPKNPDINDVPCHFGVRSSNTSIVQKSPQNEMEIKNKLTLLTGTDIRLNDKVVDCDTGFEYTAELPRNIRGHHVFVYLQRTRPQKAL